MPFLLINHLNYAYGISGSGPTVLLLHGFTGSQQSWRSAVPQLTADFQVLTVDLPGHGQSDAPADPKRYQMEQVAADLVALCTSLGCDPIHLFGYSMGARLALYVALSYPEHIKSVVLESGGPGLAIESAREQRQELDEALARRVEEDGINSFVDYWESLPLWQSQSQINPAPRAELRAQRLQNRPQGLANSLRGMGTGAQPSLWERLPYLQRPALLIAGELDSKFVAINKQMSISIPQCNYQIVSGAGHAVHLERPDHFWQLVLDFWREESRAG